MRNSRRAGLLAAVFISGLVAAPVMASAETLADAIALAYKSNPNLLRQRSSLRNSDEAYFRTRAGLGPSLTANLTVSAASSTDLLHGGGPSPTFGSTTSSDNTNSSIGLTASATANQTIYSGGAKAAAMDSQRDSLLSARESLRTTEQTLLQQVVSAYTGVRSAEQQLVIAQAQLDSNKEAYNQATAKFQAGAATRTDQAQAESRVAQSQTSLTSAQNTLANARITYLTVIGQMPGTLAEQPALDSALPASEAAAYAIAQQNSPTLRQAYLQERISAEAIVTAKAAYRPTVTLNTGPTFSDTARFPGVGFGYGNTSGQWASSLTMSVPIYPGRTTASSVRSAEETNASDRISIESARRTLNQQINTAWNALVAARSQMISQTQAVTAQTLTTEGTIEQFKQGLSTSLDELNAQLELATAQQALVTAKFAEYNAGVALLVAMGQISPDTFGAKVENYDPLAHFNQINGSADLPWTPLIENLDRIGTQPPPAYVPAPGEVVPQFKAP